LGLSREHGETRCCRRGIAPNCEGRRIDVRTRRRVTTRALREVMPASCNVGPVHLRKVASLLFAKRFDVDQIELTHRMINYKRYSAAFQGNDDRREV
jgi:hypothetical protein